MGWTGTHRPYGQSLREYFEESFNYENEERSARIIEYALVHMTTAYIAYEIHDKVKDEKRVVAIVVLVRMTRDYYNLHYKEMDETMGPNEHACPMKVFKLLTPLPEGEEQYAHEWRKRVTEYHEAKAKHAAFWKTVEVNDTIVFNRPLSFGSYGELDTFTLYQKRPLKLKHKDYPYTYFRVRRNTLHYPGIKEHRKGKVLS